MEEQFGSYTLGIHIQEEPVNVNLPASGVGLLKNVLDLSKMK